MLFVSTEYILIAENPRQMHPKCGKTAQRSGGRSAFVDGTHTDYRQALMMLPLSLALQTIPHAKKIVNIDKFYMLYSSLVRHFLHKARKLLYAQSTKVDLLSLSGSTGT